MSLPTTKIKEAIEKAREVSPARNFEQSFDLAINLRELDMNRPDNRVNIRFQLPNGIGEPEGTRVRLRRPSAESKEGRSGRSSRARRT